MCLDSMPCTILTIYQSINTSPICSNCLLQILLKIIILATSIMTQTSTASLVTCTIALEQIPTQVLAAIMPRLSTETVPTTTATHSPHDAVEIPLETHKSLPSFTV